MQFIVSKKEFIPPLIAPDIIETLGNDYEIWTYEDYERLPPLLVGVYSYSAIPKCLVPLSTQGLVKSGVFRLQREFVPGLYGNGVYVVVIDTGVNYAQEAFMTPEGKTKIAVLWDQNTDTVYSEDEINAAILSENPYESIPGDEDGHGTFVASVICGNDRPQDDFAGVAPQAKLIVVKLKRAPQNLYDFYFIPDRKIVYSEADVMRAVHFADEFAGQKGVPAVFCMALGCNNGSHTGAEDLSEYLDYITAKRGRAVVAASGNEANSRHHYKGRITDTVDDIEINVEQDMDGFYLECWALSPELFTLSVISPSGQSNPAGVPMRPDSGEYSFLLEGTAVTIDYRQTGRQTRDMLIFIRFEKVVKGVWTIRVFPLMTIGGVFNMWLPMTGLLDTDVSFIVSEPDTTLTMPSDAKLVITAGGYNSLNDAILLESGRGFDADGGIKPDLVAPAVDITGANPRGMYIALSGTSAAAAITAAVAALIMEWMIVRGNLVLANGVDIKNAMVRNCRRKEKTDYPNKIFGYGFMNGFANF